MSLEILAFYFPGNPQIRPLLRESLLYVVSFYFWDNVYAKVFVQSVFFHCDKGRSFQICTYFHVV